MLLGHIVIDNFASCTTVYLTTSTELWLHTIIMTSLWGMHLIIIDYWKFNFDNRIVPLPSIVHSNFIVTELLWFLLKTTTKNINFNYNITNVTPNAWQHMYWHWH